MKPFKKRVFIVLILLSLIYFASIKFYPLIMPTISRYSKDGNSIKNSKFVGREIKLAPFLVLAKLKEYSGGWPDQYYYVVSGVPKLDVSSEPNSIILLSQTEIFRVIDVKFKMASLMMGPKHDKEVCIIQNSRSPDLMATINCNNLSIIDEIAEIYSSVELEIKKYGSSFISTEKYDPSISKPLYRVNSFYIYRLKTLKELVSLFFSNEDNTNPNPAEYLMYETLPFLISRENGLNEKTLSLLVKNSKFGYFLRFQETDGGRIRDEFLKNELPKDVEDWIVLNYPESANNRWVLRVLAAFFFRQILSNEKQDEISTREHFALVEEVSSCLSTFFDSSKTIKEHFQKLKDRILEDESLRKKFNEVYHLSQNPINVKYRYYSGGCTELSPPKKISNDQEIFN